jgi:hypothetical protein
MGETFYCERCWADVPGPFQERHDAWHRSGGPWQDFFTEVELESWSANAS